MKTNDFRISLFILCCALLPSMLVAQSVPIKKKSADKKSYLEPALTNIQGQLSFDKTTIKALERGKASGVLIGEKEETGKIHRIEVLGAKKTEPDAVILRLSSKIGHAFSPILVADDINEIVKMGLFTDVQVFSKVLPSGAVELAFTLKEVPTIFQIKIKGNQSLSEDEVKESIAGLDNYQVAKETRLKESAEKIREFYVSKGYYLATVNYEVKPTNAQDIKKREAEGLNDASKSLISDLDVANAIAPDFVDVIFNIKENSKVQINRIYFLGNKFLSDDSLKPLLRSQEEHLISVLSDWGTFRKDYLEIDGLIIEKTLHDNGFLQAKILPPIVELSPDQSHINIGFPMVENDQYRLSQVKISGDLVEKSEAIYNLRKASAPDEQLFLTSELLKSVQQQDGDIFNKSMMAESILGISEQYRDAGFAYVNISPIQNLNQEEKTVEIDIQIQSGPKVYVERIEIEGNEKTKDEVIRRELVIFEGDLYSSSLIRLSEQKVRQLGYFETVEFSNQPGSDSDQMILTIKIKEQNTGNIQLGAGYGSGGEGLVIRGQIANQNLFGRGQTLSASVNWSNYRRMFDVSFIDPYLTYVFDNPLTFAFTAYNRGISMGEFYRKSTGGDLTLGYPIGGSFAEVSRRWKKNVRESLEPYVFDFEALYFLLTYTVERVEISEVASDVRKWDLHRGQPRYTTSLKPTIRLDQRDNRLFPTRGLFFEFQTEFASSYLGGSQLSSLENYVKSKSSKKSLSDGRNFLAQPSAANNFIRFGSTLRFYHSLDGWFFLKGLVFKTNMELGVLNTLGDPIIFENYYLGGSNALRGYPYRSIGPTARASALFPFDPQRDLRIGGNKQFFGSLELEFPIFKALKLSGAFFFDFGNVYSPEDNFFFVGGKSRDAVRIKPTDPLGLYRLLGLYSSAGFGIRWLSPMGYLRFEWGFPISRRPSGTPGLSERDPAFQFEFNIGPSF